MGKWFVTILAGILALPVTAKADPEEAPGLVAGSGLAGQIPEIVVTARRREEPAQDVPIGLSVLGGDSLDASFDYQPADLNQQVPDLLTVAPNARNITYSIRGIGAGATAAGTNDGLEPSVGIFLDGVYLGRPGLSFQDFADLDRIEILRGPQGTLYGKNTTAGAINIWTVPPGFVPEIKAESSVGSFGFNQQKASVTAPLADDQLSVRLSAYRTQDDGFLTDPRSGDSWNGELHEGVRGQFFWKPDADFNLRVIADFDRTNDKGTVTSIVDYGADIPNIPAANRYLARIARVKTSTAYTLLPADPFQRDVAIDGHQRSTTDQNALTAIANWNVLGHTLTSIASSRSWQFQPQNDGTGLATPVTTQSGANSHQRQFSEELRLASPSGQTVEYVGGLYYFWQKLEDWNQTSFGPGAAPFYAAGAQSAWLANFNTLLHSGVDTSSYAAFSQAIWHIDPQWSLTGGVRYTVEYKGGFADKTGYGGLPLAAFVPGLRPTILALRENVSGLPSAGLYANSGTTNFAENAVSGLGTLSYKFTPDILGYATFSRGFKSGGYLVQAPLNGLDPHLRPEEATDVEFGAKTDFLDRRLQVNGDVYTTYFKNYQAQWPLYGPLGNLLPGAGVTNAGGALARGAEIDVTAIPFDGLRLNAGGAYNRALYTSFHNAPCPVEHTGLAGSCDLSGRPVMMAPRWAFNAGAEYTHRLGSVRVFGATLSGHERIEYAYKSSYFSALDDSAYSAISGYGVVNMLVGLGPDNERWDLTFWVKNLFDQNYFTAKAVFNNSGLVTGLLGDPLTLGATFKVKF